LRPYAQALGKKPVVLLPNHGAITTGPSIQSALFRMMLLEGMCQRNLGVAAAAKATGLTPHAIKPEHALTAKNELAKIPIIENLWEDLLKRLRQTDAELFEQNSPAHHVRSEALSA
jgi:hypothetical protein